MANCAFDGNSDFYGLGIRIGFYLQWYSSILASWFAPSEIEGLRFSNSVFIAATFLALVIVTARDVSGLHVVEVYIVLLLTFGFYLFLVPLYIWRSLTRCNPYYDPTRWHAFPVGPVYSVLVFLLIIAVASYQIWFWSVRVLDLNTQGCQEYGFLCAKVRLNEPVFQVLGIITYALLLLFCLINLLRSALIKLRLVPEIDWRDRIYSRYIRRLTFWLRY